MIELKDSEGKPLSGDALIREMTRRTNDEFTVFNPTAKDFKLVYDGRVWLFPHKDKNLGNGAGTNRVPRYIALHYMDKMSLHMMNQDYERKVSIEKKNYKGDDWQWKGELEFATREGLRTDNIENRRKYVKQFNIVLVRHFGLDDLNYSHEEALKPKADIPVMDVLMEEMEILVQEQPEPVKLAKPKTDKAKLAESIAQ